MGRKPVFGLVGACLASVALTGGCQNSSTGAAALKKDSPAIANNNSNNSRTTGSDQGWRNQPSSTASGPNAFGGGTTVGTASGGSTAGMSTGVRPAAGTGTASPYSTGGSMTTTPTGAYPEGRSMPTTPTAPGTTTMPSTGTPSADMNGSRSTVPTNFNDAAPSGVVARPTPSTLPPLPGTGPATPRVDDLPATGRTATPATPVISSTPSTSAPLPPIAPVTDAPAAGSVPSDVPPLPAPSSQMYQKPATSAPSVGVPSLPQNPATMQNK